MCIVIIVDKNVTQKKQPLFHTCEDMVTTSTWKFEVIPSDLQVRPALHVALVSVNGKK